MSIDNLVCTFDVEEYEKLDRDQNPLFSLSKLYPDLGGRSNQSYLVSTEEVIKVVTISKSKVKRLEFFWKLKILL